MKENGSIVLSPALNKSAGLPAFFVDVLVIHIVIFCISPVDCSFDRFLFLLPYPPLIPPHIHYSLIWSSIL